MHEIMKLNRSKSACRIHWASHDTVEFLSEKNSQIQPDFRIRLLSMHVGEN